MSHSFTRQFMKSSFITHIIWLVFVSSVRAQEGTEIPVTPTNLDTYFYHFSVSTNATSRGVAFQVTIKSKQSAIYPDSVAEMENVIHRQLTNGTEVSIESTKPAIPVALKKKKRLWTADFTVSRDLLKNPDLSFVFTVAAHGASAINGEAIPMPLVAFYELRLQEFVKP